MGEDRKGTQAPYAGVVSEAVAKIKDQPLLFVIAIAALLVGLAVMGTDIAPGNLRFVVVVIALLAFVAIVGYYVASSFKARKRPTTKLSGEVKVGEASDRASVAGAHIDPDALPPNADISGTAEVGKAKGDATVGGVVIGKPKPEEDETD